MRRNDKSNGSNRAGFVRYRILNNIRLANSSWTVRRPKAPRYVAKLVTVYAVYVSA